VSAEAYITNALSTAMAQWSGTGLASAFVLTIGIIVLFVARAETNFGIGQGFLGLTLLLVTIFYFVMFSFLIAASVKGIDVKLMFGAVDGVVLIGSKSLTSPFLHYLESGSNDERRASDD
jgi:hypothetical protein